MRLSTVRLLLAALPPILAEPAAASDGVLNINAACAVQTGCFTGDTADYPVTITTPGSYVLTSNLVVPNANTTGILVSAPSVHIDLNGFEIVRSGCEGAILECTPGSGTGKGIAVTSDMRRGVSVENGAVTGMGSEGIHLGEQAVVTKVKARWNRLNGIRVGSGSIVSESAAFGNGASGIYTQSGATVSETVASDNASHGIDVGTGSTVSSSSAYLNGQTGIMARQAGSIVTGNSVSVNGGDGIYANSSSNVSSNSVASNGGDGIEAYWGVNVTNNSIRLNGEYGLHVGSGTVSAYRDNTIMTNTLGAVNGNAAERGGNYCAGTGVVSDTCP